MKKGDYTESFYQSCRPHADPARPTFSLTLVWRAAMILVGKMWKGLVDWASASMLDPRLQLANPEDLRIPQCLETADEAIAVVRRPHAQWQTGQAKG